MLRNLLLAFSIALFALASCGDSEKPGAPEQSGGSTNTEVSKGTIDPSLIGVQLSKKGLENKFPELVEQARKELASVSGLDLADLEFKIADEEKILDTLVANLSFQDIGKEEDYEREDLRELSRGMIGIYSMTEGKVYVSLDNFEWLTDVMEMPGSFTKEVLFAVIAHEGVHAIADRKYGLVKLIESMSNESELMAANAVIEGYAQVIARDVCAKTNMTKGIDGMTELITTVPDIDDPVAKMQIAVMVQQFAFAYVEGESFLNALVAAKGEAGLDQAFAAPPTSRAYVNNPDWYMDPNKRPGADYQVEDALDVFDAFFAEDEWTTQRQDFDKGLLRTAASALPEEDVKEYVDAVIQTRLTLGMAGGVLDQQLVVCALHHCQSIDHAVRLVELSKQLVNAKEEMMKDSATQITESKMDEVDKPGFSGFKLSQTVDVGGSEVGTQTVQIIKGDLVCEMTFVNTEYDQEDAVQLAFDVLNKATSVDKSED